MNAKTFVPTTFRRMRSLIAFVVLVCAMAGQALADGKMFGKEDVPPSIPYQRAIILFDEGVETLILQSRYEIPGGDGKPVLGWVVPVPAVPEVASIPAEVARDVFWTLDRRSRPTVTVVSSMVFTGLFLSVAGLSLLTLLLCLISFVLPLPRWFRDRRGRFARYAMWGVLLCFLMLFIVPNFVLTRGKSGVEVVSEQHVGIYDVRVIRSDDVGTLIDWLNENQFTFGDKDSTVFNSYVSKGWCFVVAIINPGTEQDERRIVADGLAAPLILRFPHPNPVYPVALTGTGGFETEILVYLASSVKMTCKGRLALRYAGPLNGGRLDFLQYGVSPKDFFDSEALDYPCLCKFKGRLTPEEMSEDIDFAIDPDQTPYREHIVRW